ncbi:MAG: hypothetical protein A2W91_11115 [Bacteroidetes bacterium GWF2_38_335]|nr:MAG: hypothetical protein A2W91_11115 [Bacteroidetes bacterium GWF2_38_335]OFY81751.1 MAG: hypothetical protein A2281_05925 [Bacteroidetes bacterium RIFOXYA12_FULL_38_20]HBS87818.1 hypothetical protein [Bacteroidales bacterium]
MVLNLITFGYLNEKNMDKDAFKRDLEEIIRLFKLLKEKAKKTGYLNIDDMHYKQIEMLVQSYDMVKDNINEQMLSQFGEPIKDMMQEMIEHLREELGEEHLYSSQAQSSSHSISENASTEDKKVIQIGPSLEEIDRILSSTNLSDKEINKLLDLRVQMKKAKEQTPQD